MGVSHTLSRRFFWAENILWKEDIQGHRVTATLAERDLIVDTEAVGAYLAGGDDWIQETETENWKDKPWKGDGLEVLWFPGLDHAQVFDKKRSRQRLVDVIRKYSVSG